MDRPEDDFIPLGKTPEKSEYIKLSEHLSVLGLERDRFAKHDLGGSFGMTPMLEKRAMVLLIEGQAQIMGALAIFARDYDPMLGVLVSGEVPPMNENLIFKGGGPEIVAAMHRQMDRMTMDDLRLPEPTEGHVWKLWTGAGASATPGVVERPADLPPNTWPEGDGRPVIRLRLRDGRVHRVPVDRIDWAHVGGPLDILAYEAPIKPG